MQYPTLSQIPDADITQLLYWNRHLPSPQDENQQQVIHNISDLLKAAREADPAGYTQSSKQIGW